MAQNSHVCQHSPFKGEKKKDVFRMFIQSGIRLWGSYIDMVHLSDKLNLSSVPKVGLEVLADRDRV